MSDDRAPLRARFPVPADRDLPPGRHLLHRENLMTQMLNEPPSGQPDPDEQPRKQRRRLSAWHPSPRRLLATAAAVAVVAGLGVTGGLKLSTHQAGPTTATANGTATPGATDTTVATLLREVGKAAGAQPGGWANAPYWYVKSTYIRDGKTYSRQFWQGHTNSGELDDTGVGPASASGPASFIVGLKTLDWDQLYQLPTDPAKLKAVMEADDNRESAYGGPAGTLFMDIGDLLSESPASPALREALYEVAATIPGVTIKGNFTDRLGRTGTAVAFDGKGGTGLPTLVIDRANGALLDAVYGEYMHVTCPQPSTGPKVSCASGAYYSYLSQGPATSEPKFPGVNTSPFVMPSVIGDTYQQAYKALAKAQSQQFAAFEIKEIKGSSSRKTPLPFNREVVVAQSPAAGAMVIPGDGGTRVTITVKS